MSCAGPLEAPAPAPAARTPTPQPSPALPAPFAGGRYEVKRFLGEGGRKRVFLAQDTGLDRDVAFSLIKTEGLDAAGLARVRREAQAMGRLGSSLLKELTESAGDIAFGEGREVELKGLAGPHRVFEVVWYPWSLASAKAPMISSYLRGARRQEQGNEEVHDACRTGVVLDPPGLRLRWRFRRGEPFTHTHAVPGRFRAIASRIPDA